MKSIKRKRLKLDDLQEIARLDTREKLGEYIIPDEYWKEIVLGSTFNEDKCIFELYLPGEKPKDAVVLTTTVVNAYTGEVTDIKITNLIRKSESQT